MIGRKRSTRRFRRIYNHKHVINQVLVEMESFEVNPKAIAVASTNRINILDRNLLCILRYDLNITAWLHVINVGTVYFTFMHVEIMWSCMFT